MANSNAPVSSDSTPTREWNLFAYHAFARIVARKHNMAVPPVDLESLSDEEIERRVRLLSELSHLPPT